MWTGYSYYHFPFDETSQEESIKISLSLICALGWVLVSRSLQGFDLLFIINPLELIITGKDVINDHYRIASI